MLASVVVDTIVIIHGRTTYVTGVKGSGKMTRTIKYMNLKEFIDEGYLQEVNRRFLHLYGLALVVNVNDKGEYTLNGIRDDRDDPEGIYFDEGEIDPEKIKHLDDIQMPLFLARLKALGYVTQPPDTP